LRNDTLSFSQTIQYATGLLPFVALAEGIFGAGAGADKKAFVEGTLGDFTQILAARFNAGEELHEEVKALRSDLIDAAVHVLNWRGATKPKEGQRLSAGLALGYAKPSHARIYRKQQEGGTLTPAEQKEWEDFKATWPTTEKKEPAPAPEHQPA